MASQEERDYWQILEHLRDGQVLQIGNLDLRGADGNGLGVFSEELSAVRDQLEAANRHGPLHEPDNCRNYSSDQVEHILLTNHVSARIKSSMLDPDSGHVAHMVKGHIPGQRITDIVNDLAWLGGIGRENIRIVDAGLLVREGKIAGFPGSDNYDMILIN